MGDGEVVELLNIAKGYLPRIRLEYDRVQGELNSWKAAINNEVRVYQDFCDRNLALSKYSIFSHSRIEKILILSAVLRSNAD
jgi:hypothetical protein